MNSLVAIINGQLLERVARVQVLETVKVEDTQVLLLTVLLGLEIVERYLEIPLEHRQLICTHLQRLVDAIHQPGEESSVQRPTQ